MKLIAASLALALAAVPATAAARTVPVAQQASSADRLVALLLPDDRIVDAVFKIVDAQMGDDSKMTPERRAVFAAYPGLKKEVVELLRTDVIAILHKALPGLHVELASIISADLTPAELEETLAFFASPTGKKMLDQIYAGIAASGTLDEEEARSKAMATMMASLTPDDYPALIAFGQSSAAPKLQTLSPRLQAASKSWSARLLQENGAALARRVDTVIAARQAQGK